MDRSYRQELLPDEIKILVEDVSDNVHLNNEEFVKEAFIKELPLLT